MKIFILSPNFNRQVDPALITKLRRAGDVTIYAKPVNISQLGTLTRGSEPRIIALDPDFCNWKAPPELFTHVPNLKAICLQTTSFSWIDTGEAKKRQIPVTHLLHWSTEAVAEWAILMAISLARRIPEVSKQNWKENNSSQQGIEVAGKVAGIIGLGNVGTRIATLCQGLGMSVIYWSRHRRDRRFTYNSLKRLMQRADFIFPAVNQNTQTCDLINESMLKAVKPTAIISNIVPFYIKEAPHIYNHELVLKMVANGKLAGYGFEVDGGGAMEKYRGNVWAGPANAWVTKEAQEKNMEQWVGTIIDASRGKFPQRVN